MAHLRASLTQAEWDATLSSELRDLALVNLAGALLDEAQLQGASLRRVNLQGASLRRTRLDEADLYRTRLQEVTLNGARLDGAVCRSAHLEGANLLGATFSGVDLRRALFDVSTNLRGIHLDDRVRGCAVVADARWDGVNLATVEWDAVPVLGDEQQARRTTDVNGKPKSRDQRLAEYSAAVRANRQLATALRNQGLNEDADRYAYRAQALQRQVLRRRGQWGRAFGSRLLDVVAGYGYKPMRSVIAYILIICLFAGTYLLNAQFAAPHLSWDEALVLSISSFHGRGFFSSGISLGDTLARLAAAEAIIGLLIEITFIATFTQRFFAR
jgi:hypothetical protein